MRQLTHTLTVATAGKGLVPVTAPVAAWVSASGVATGLLTVFIRHTSASLLIQENADPTVRADLEAFFAWLVPEASATATTARGRTTCRPISAPR